VEIHYHKTGRAAEDQSEIGLYFSKSPQRQMQSLFVSGTAWTIPAGAEKFTVRASHTLQQATTIHTLLPMMKHLGTRMTASAHLPDGETRLLLDIQAWNMDWQMMYQLVHPITLPAETVIHVTSTYDNSENNPRNPNSPPRDVRFGHQSDREVMTLVLGCYLEGQRR